MVDSISSFSSISSMGMQPRTASALTDEQKATVTSILSEYDPENVTEEDAKSIFEAFKEAGIQPGAGLKETVEAAGFDMDSLRPAKPDGMQGPPPPPPSDSTSELDVEQLQSIQEILNQYDLTNLSEDDEESLVSSLNQAGFMGTGVLVDKKS